MRFIDIFNKMNHWSVQAAIFTSRIQSKYWEMQSRKNSIQKQPPRGVLKKRCSEDMQQIYRRSPMPKCEIALRHGCSPANLLNVFRTHFPRNTSGWLLLPILDIFQTTYMRVRPVSNYHSNYFNIETCKT